MCFYKAHILFRHVIHFIFLEMLRTQCVLNSLILTGYFVYIQNEMLKNVDRCIQTTCTLVSKADFTSCLHSLILEIKICLWLSSLSLAGSFLPSFNHHFAIYMFNVIIALLNWHTEYLRPYIYKSYRISVTLIQWHKLFS